MKRISFLTLVLLFIPSAHARLIQAWSYDMLQKESDIVVIGRPISISKVNGKTEVPGIGRIGSGNKKVTGWATELNTVFEIATVLKGDSAAKTIVLHHFHENEEAIDGQLTHEFDPSKKVYFLLFLKKTANGTFEPVAGQADPILSIKALENL